MNYLADNLRYLRNVKGLSQTDFAREIIITRSAYSKYELGASDPSPETLLRISQYYHVAIELLITYDLRKVDMQGLLHLEENKIYVPMLVDNDGENFIEIIPHAAKAGYLAGFSDPEFIEKLNRISLPFLRDGKFRAFPIEGDSMPPHNKGSYIVGRYIEKIEQIVEGRTYLIITENEGIVYKRVARQADSLLLISEKRSREYRSKA